MGSLLEINDTLQITEAQGFPSDVLNLSQHQANPVQLADLKDRTFSFHGKDRARFYQSDPVRVFLVENIGGKWLFWGKIFIESQTIGKKLDAAGKWINEEYVTSGTFRIVDVYEPEYQKAFTIREAPEGKSYF